MYRLEQGTYSLASSDWSKRHRSPVPTRRADNWHESLTSTSLLLPSCHYHNSHGVPKLRKGDSAVLVLQKIAMQCSKAMLPTRLELSLIHISEPTRLGMKS